jgi:hypothetical protein
LDHCITSFNQSLLEQMLLWWYQDKALRGVFLGEPTGDEPAHFVTWWLTTGDCVVLSRQVMKSAV